MKNDGGAAFPYFREIPEKKLDEVMTVFHPGMKLRDWFAGQANEEDVRNWTKIFAANNVPITREEAKYYYADAMIAERER